MLVAPGLRMSVLLKHAEDFPRSKTGRITWQTVTSADRCEREHPESAALGAK